MRELNRDKVKGAIEYHLEYNNIALRREEIEVITEKYIAEHEILNIYLIEVVVDEYLLDNGYVYDEEEEAWVKKEEDMENKLDDFLEIYGLEKVVEILSVYDNLINASAELMEILEKM